jgi:hypothetical protein
MLVGFFILPPDYCSPIPSAARESDTLCFHMPASDKAKKRFDMRLQYMQASFQRHSTYVPCHVP